MNTIDEVNEMNRVFNEVVESIEAPKVEAEVTAEPEPEGEPVAEEEVVNTEPEPEPASEPEPELDEKDKLIEELRAKVAALTTKEEPKAEPEPKVETKIFSDEPVNEIDFIGNLDMEEVYNDPKQFNKLLNSIYEQAVTNTRKSLAEGILRTIPDIVKANIVTVTGMQKASEEFYAANKDLEPFKKVVATVFEEVASANPGKTYKEVIALTGPEVRRRLGLQRKALQKSPRLPNAGGRQQRAAVKPDLDPLQNELEAMNKALR